MLQNISLVVIIIDLFILVILYILATFMAVFLKRNSYILTPVIFGFMYSIYYISSSYNCFPK
jgi:hypothetical protein